MIGDGYYIDRDPRPKTEVCRHCAREVEKGKRCFCAATEEDKRPSVTITTPWTRQHIER